MPIRKVSGGYKWGGKGKVYPTRAGAAKQAAAAYASGYQGKNSGGSVMLNKDNAAKELAYIARTQGKDAAMSVVKAYENMLTPADINAAMSIINMNCGGMVKRNMGGDIPRYNTGGGLLNHPYEREGEQFDTVPAMLTPGEFVVDADSAHKFGDELEQINNWEPNGEADESGEEYISEDEAVEIKRKFKDGTEIIVKSPEGSKTEVSGLLSSLTKAAKRKGYEVQGKNKGGLLYANTGAEVQSIAPAPTAGILTPAQQQQAQSQQLAGAALAGLGSQSGQYLAGMGNRALQGHQDALKAQEKSATEENTEANIVALIQEAATLIQEASTAGDLINGYVKLSETEEQSIKEQVSGFLSGIVQTAAGAFDQTRRVREEARARIVSASHPKSYSAYTRLKALANQMVFPVLSSGVLGVNPTDADVTLAKSAQFDVEAPSSSWADQLNALSARNGGPSDIPPVTYPKPEEKPAAAPVDDAAAITEEPSKVEAAKDKVENAVEALSDVGATVKDKVIAKLEGVDGTGTAEDPYIVPRTAFTKKRALKWIEDKDLPDDAMVTYKGITGTVAQLIEYLTREG